MIEVKDDNKIRYSSDFISYDNTILLRESLSRFETWLSEHGLASHDPYSLWSTSYGIWSKQFYQRNKKLGLLAIAPIIVGDILAPKLLRTFLPKYRYPIADAHIILAKCNQYRTTSKSKYLVEAETLAEELLAQSLFTPQSGYHGHCWGYPFNWQTNQGLWESSTPLITTTPYCYSAFVTLYECTRNHKYYDIAKSCIEFALRDLNTTIIDENRASSSYSPIDSTLVINANAYRLYMLIDWLHRTQDCSYSITMLEPFINFILSSQNDDGSWFYALSSQSDRFIDNFHTCLVLKNLIKVNSYLKRDDISQAINRGYDYYIENLLGDDYTPRPFSVLSRSNPVSLEMYDYAESINLAFLLKDTHHKAKEVLNAQLNQLCSQYQCPQGYFLTKIYLGFIPNDTPYIRWAQSQLYYVLSCLVSEVSTN
jgi:hypothetical protein